MPGNDVKTIESLQKKLSDKIRSVISISAVVRVMFPGSIERSVGKGNHVIDNRILK